MSSEKLIPALTALLTAVRLQSFFDTVRPTSVAVIAGSALSAPSASATRLIAASVRAVYPPARWTCTPDSERRLQDLLEIGAFVHDRSG